MQLPTLNKVLFKALFTFFKGIKIKERDIEINKIFTPTIINKIQLKEYKILFNFTEVLPLTYLYLLAQRAQVALMLDKQFTIAIPGLIHASNTLEQVNELELDKVIKIESSVFVESKKEGSLNPIFKVQFYQNDILVAKCESIYLAKRKSKSLKKKRIAPSFISNPTHENTWNVTKSDALNYAEISGDKNPIHTFGLIAKLFGFKSTIIHGWYLVSKMTSEIKKNQTIKSISCNFIKPVTLPQELKFKYDSTTAELSQNEILSATLEYKI